MANLIAKGIIMFYLQLFFLISMPADSSDDLVLMHSVFEAMHCLRLRRYRRTIISLLRYRADTATAGSLVLLESC